LRWRLPAKLIVAFEAITNEAICPATKIHLLYHVIILYNNQMATLHGQFHGLVKDENPPLFC